MTAEVLIRLDADALRHLILGGEIALADPEHRAVLVLGLDDDALMQVQEIVRERMLRLAPTPSDSIN